jgi:hypothetical protein
VEANERIIAFHNELGMSGTSDGILVFCLSIAIYQAWCDSLI